MSCNERAISCVMDVWAEVILCTLHHIISVIGHSVRSCEPCMRTMANLHRNACKTHRRIRLQSCYAWETFTSTRRHPSARECESRLSRHILMSFFCSERLMIHKTYLTHLFSNPSWVCQWFVEGCSLCFIFNLCTHTCYVLKMCCI